jgi:hypothetical protein
MSRSKTGVRRRRATKRKRVGGGVGTMLKRAFDFSRRRHKTEVSPSTFHTRELPPAELPHAELPHAQSHKVAVLPRRHKTEVHRSTLRTRNWPSAQSRKVAVLLRRRKIRVPRSRLRTRNWPSARSREVAILKTQVNELINTPRIEELKAHSQMLQETLRMDIQVFEKLRLPEETSFYEYVEHYYISRMMQIIDVIQYPELLKEFGIQDILETIKNFFRINQLAGEFLEIIRRARSMTTSRFSVHDERIFKEFTDILERIISISNLNQHVITE